ncbi:MAG: hypothetical protein Q9223_006304 [Gallowayella weberi]
MSSQEHCGITFCVAREQQNVRLLELPPALLARITSQHPSSLSLKSTAPTEGASGHAVLCSNDQTFQLRQVHSSNSVFLLQPSFVATTTDQTPWSEGLTAIAKCEATLEAIPQATACTPLLKTILPVFSSQHGADMPISIEARGRQAIFQDLPVSSREFDQSWKDLCAFETEGRAFRPSAAVCWIAWRSIVDACTLKGLSFNRELDVISLARTVGEDDVPEFVVAAIIDRLRSDEGVPQKSQARSGDAHPANLSDFLRDWKDQLPESWRQQATIDILKGNFTQPSKDTILFAEGNDDTGKGISSAATAKASGPQARKWHEKFKNTRR